MDTVYATRMRLGWSQQQLADVLKVTKRTIGGWERGEHTPSHADLIMDRLRVLEHEQDSRQRGRPTRKRRKS